jgi:hypothetical protein
MPLVTVTIEIVTYYMGLLNKTTKTTTRKLGFGNRFRDTTKRSV